VSAPISEAAGPADFFRSQEALGQRFAIIASICRRWEEGSLRGRRFRQGLQRDITVAAVSANSALNNPTTGAIRPPPDRPPGGSKCNRIGA
jgi:hypothetical protein